MKKVLRSDDPERTPKVRQIEPPIQVIITKADITPEEQLDVFQRILQILRADPDTDPRK